MKKLKRLVSFMLTCCVLITAVPASTWAADAVHPFDNMKMGESFDLNGKNYINIGLTNSQSAMSGANSETVLKALFANAYLNENGKTARRLSELWLDIAAANAYDLSSSETLRLNGDERAFVLSPSGGTGDGAVERRQDLASLLMAPSAYYYGKLAADEEYNNKLGGLASDRVEGKVNNSSGPDNAYYYGNTVGNVFNLIKNDVVARYKAVGGSREDDIVYDVKELSEDTTGPALGSVRIVSRDGTGRDGHYAAVGVIFSNIQLNPLVPGSVQGTATGDTTSSSPSFSSGYQNSSDQTITAAQTLEVSETESVSNTVETSETFSFTESLSISQSFSVDALFASSETEISMSIGAEQAFSTAWSEQKTVENTINRSTDIEVSLPAYTQIVLEQESGDTNYTSAYDMPVAFSYDVTVFALSLDYDSSDADPKGTILATYNGEGTQGASDAQEDIQIRAVESGNTDSDNIDWNASRKSGGLYTYSRILDVYDGANNYYTLSTQIAKAFENRAPMSVTGASMTYKKTGSSSKISGITPILPLSNTKAEMKEYVMNVGDYLYLDDIEVEGYNAQNAVYYGFNSDNGSWIDDNSGVVATDKTTSAGHKILTAENAGEAVIEYRINEDVFPADPANVNNTATLSSDKVDSAKILIRVEEPEASDEYSVAVADSAVAYVGETFSLNRELAPSITKNGSIIPAFPQNWSMIDGDINSVYDSNSQTFTTPGTYYIYGAYSNTYTTAESNYCIVEVQDAKTVNSIQIADNRLTPALFTDTSIAEGRGETAELNLNYLSLSATDQYGNNIGLSDYGQWKCAPETGVSIDNTTGMAVISTPGTYQFYYEDNGVTSNMLPINVAARHKITWSDTSLGSIYVTDANNNLVTSGSYITEGTQLMVHAQPDKSAELKWMKANQTDIYDGSSYIINEDTDLTAAFGFDLSQATIEPVSDQLYTGLAIEPGIMVKIGSRTLKEGTDYVATYYNNTKAGTATVEITPVEGTATTGSQRATFAITYDNYRIVLKGSLTGTVGQTYQLGRIDTIQAIAYGDDDLQKNVEFSWEMRSLPAEGADVTADGKITFTKAGTYQVRAYCNSSYSDWISVKANNVVIKPVLRTTDRTKTSISLRWDALDNINGYALYTYKGDAKRYADITWLSSSAVSYQLKGLKAGTDYSFVLTPYTTEKGKKIYGNASERLEVTTKPKATSLERTGSTRSTLSISWDAVTPVDGYRVQRYDNDSKTITKTYFYNRKTTSAKLTGLKAGTRVKLVISSYRKSSSGNVYSARAKAVTTYTNPGLPTLSKSSGGSTAVSVSWNKVKNASGYEIRRYGGSRLLETKTVKAKKDSLKFSGLVTGSSQSFSIRSYKKLSDGTKIYSPWSKALKVTVKPGTPKLSLKSQKGKTVKLKWSTPSLIDGYVITRYVNGKKKAAEEITVKAGKSSATVKGLKKGTTQKFVIRAYRNTSSGKVYSSKSKAVTVKIN